MLIFPEKRVQMNKARLPAYEIVFTTLIMLGVLASLTLIILYIYAEIVYGKVAVVDCPTWVLWLFKGGI